MIQVEQKAVLLLAYGGPQNTNEVGPFLASILNNGPVSEHLVVEYERRYRSIGGASPLNDLTADQARALKDTLNKMDVSSRVGVGFLHSSPSIPDALQNIVATGVEEIFFVVMNPFHSEASYQRYEKKVGEALKGLKQKPSKTDFLPSFYAERGFIEANADNTQKTLQEVPDLNRESTPVVFTAHSLPEKMVERSPYVSQLERTARSVAEAIVHPCYRIGFQSKSSRREGIWLGPDITEIIDQEAERGVTDLVVVPIGFVCDHLEVLYDLDIEAKTHAQEKGVILRRVPTVGCHPSFIETLARMIASG
jgi:protoporphyrin/coproporphyrin ferrochelatase